MKRFENKIVLISGAGSGIGRLMAQKLAQRGALIAVVDFNEVLGLETVSLITKDLGKAVFFRADVSSLNDVLNLKTQIHQKLGKVDILINNAGIVVGGEFEKLDLSKHDQTYMVNVLGLVRMTHLFFDDLKTSAKASIVNISSASGMIGLPYGTTYASSKWAVLGFSESLRLEIKERGIKNIKVTTVCPSYIATGMFSGVKAPFLIPWLKPETIVEKIILGIEREVSFVKEPFMVKYVDLLKGILPLSIFDFVAKLIGVSSSMTHWRGR